MATREEMRIVVTAQDQTAAAFNSLKRHLGGIQGVIGQVQTLIAGFGAVQIVSQIRRAVGSIDDIGDAAERVGMKSATFQAIRFQLGQFGGDAEMANRAMDKFSDSVAEAALGGGYLSKVFNANGVALRDANGQLRTNEELLADFARLVANAGSAQEKLKIATDAFGRQSGPKMVTTLEHLNRVGLKEFIDQGRAAGVIMSDELIEKADKLDRQWKVLEERSSKAFKEFAITAAPIAIDALSAIEKLFRSINYEVSLLAQGRIADALGLGVGMSGGGGLWDPARLPMLDARRRLAIGEGSRMTQTGANDFYSAVGINDPLRITVGGRTKLPDVGGSSGFDSALDAARKRIELVKAETDAIGLNSEARERARVIIDLEAAAKKANKDAGFANIEVTEKQRVEINKLADAMFAAEKRQREMKTAWEGMNDAARFFGNTAQTFIEGIFDRTKSKTELATQAIKSFTSALLQAALTGEGAFAKLLGFSSPSGGAGGLAGALLGAFRGGGISTGTATSTGILGVAPFAPAHSGGMVGALAGTRHVSPLVFAGAERFHSGGMLGPGERPIIAKDGEEVGWPGQLARKYGSRVNVNVINQAGADVDVQERRGPGGDIDLEISLNRKIDQRIGSGGADRALRRHGAAPTVTRR